VLSPSPSYCSLFQVKVLSFSRLLRHLWRKERGAILLFCPGHHTRLINLTAISKVTTALDRQTAFQINPTENCSCISVAVRVQSYCAFGLQFYCSRFNCIQTASELQFGVAFQMWSVCLEPTTLTIKSIETTP
jgi:hypothetical protein